MRHLCSVSVISVCLSLAVLIAGCVGGESPGLSTTTVVPPPSLAVDPCPLSLANEQVSAVAPASGLSQTFEVVTGASCDWTVESQSSFIAIASERAGRGSATVTLTIQPNTGAPRSGYVVVNQLTITVTQAAPPCDFSLSSTGQSFDADGGTGSVDVSVRQGVECQWTASSDASFVVVTSGTSRTGNGSVAFTVAANPLMTARSTSLSIAGMRFSVSQAARVTDPPRVVGLTLSVHQQPWCASPFTIRSDPEPDFPVVNRPGAFTFPARPFVVGTVVQLTGSAGGAVSEWSDCDNGSGSACRVSMTSNREVSASITQNCASPALTDVSTVDVAGVWRISFTALNLVPFAGSVTGGTQFTAACGSSYTTSISVPTTGSGSYSSAINVPASACPFGGTLSVSDFNGSASTSWEGDSF